MIEKSKLVYTGIYQKRGDSMFIHSVCKTLDDANIPYAVVGGYAVALHGGIRGTIDVDIVISWTLDNLKKVENALTKLGLVSLLPLDSSSVFHFRKEYIEKRNMIAWNFYDPINPANQLDIIINYNLKEGHTRTISTPSGKIKVLSRKDLIIMKRKSGRQQDLEDVKTLENL